MGSAAMNSVPVEQIVQQVAWLLLGAALAGMLAHYIRIPYAVALVVGGLLVEESHLVAVPRLDPDLVLFAFLPPLLFDAAFRLDERELRVVFRPILVLAVPGVLITALIVGGVLALVLGLPLAVALLFGSLVAATDPIAVVSIFRRLRVPGRVSTIIEGESLINDGMALTLYTALLGLAVTGQAAPLAIAGLFFWEVLGGVALGLALGFVFSRLTALIDDHLVEMTISTALAYGSFLIADSLHSSGTLACVAAGLVHGSYGRRVGMSQNTRQLLDDLWEYLGFLANSLVFLLVGFSQNIASLLAQVWPVVVAIAAVLLSRALILAVPALLTPGNRLLTTRGDRVLLFWGGLRGALTIALVLALPPNTPGRDLLTGMAFGVVLFTLVVQGLSLPWLIRRVQRPRAAAATAPE